MKRFTALLLLFVPILSSCGCTGIDTTEPTSTMPPETECTHEQTESLTEEATALKNGLIKTLCKNCGNLLDEQVIPATKSLKILAIGNSFSQDSTTYLYDLFITLGVENVVVGNAFIAGCTIDKHYQMAQSGEEAYSYTKYTSEGQEKVSSSLSNMLKDENWDIITLQQASGYSGIPADYAHLGDLINYVQETSANPNADIKFHMTWAYHKTSTNGHFEKYGDNQMTMYEDIIDTVKSEVLTKSEITGVIPVGTAIQNLSTSYIGDTLHRDSASHLTYDIGRYTAGLTWACYLTGVSPYDIEWYPKSYMAIENDIDAIREAVANAIATPYEITESSMPTKTTDTEENLFAEAGLNISNYKIIDWEPKPEYCWNSTKNAKTTRTTGYLFYTASRMFTKEELPIGSVIVVDGGYQYRPEGWTALDQVNASTDRPKTQNTPLTIVTEEWWGNFNYRAFNISMKGNSGTATAEDATHFRIYIPKN